ETLMLAEESRSKMLQKQNEPIMSKKKVNTKPVDYATLNQLSKDFETRYVPQTKLSAEQAFWSWYSVQPEELNLSSSTTIVEVPKELPKISMETLLLEDESRSKMIQKQNDPIMSEKKVITKPVDYASLNQLLKDFETRFVPQTELSVEQAFWSQYSVQFEEPNLSSSTTIVEVPKELPKVSMVNS
nr:hypothetical protein [Tanacetum cinerariifolium]